MTFPQFEHPDLQAAFKDPREDLRSFLNHPVNGEAFLRAKRTPSRSLPPGRRLRRAGTGTGGIRDRRRRGEDPRLLAEQARWTLLTQIDTDDRAGMTWGDCGALYWLFRRDEMSASRLAPTSFTWQCA